MASYEDKKQQWEANEQALKKLQLLKRPKKNPKMLGIEAQTARGLRFKALKYLLSHDQEFRVLFSILKRPVYHSFRYLRSLFSKGYKEEGDLFFYGVKDFDSFKKRARQEETKILLGFSYCQKPLECPSGRFTEQCELNRSSPICAQCPIGKAICLSPKDKVQPLLIKTVHHVGDELIKFQKQHPQSLFLITACEMTLKMFANFGYMVGGCGIGLRLQGRICNTLRAFELSEKGIKPGLTWLEREPEERLHELLQSLWQ